MTFYDAVRILNLALTVILLYKCNKRTVRDWPAWTRRERAVRVHLTAYLFALGYGTVEAFTQHAAAGPRIIVVLAVHLSFFLALWRNRHDSPATRR